jgi:hypothetical protein
MSTTTRQSDDDASSATSDDTAVSSIDDDADLDSKLQRLRSYLREQAREQGELYCKSKFIAEDVGLSPKEIGARMVTLQESASDLEIEPWSYTGATTWRITLA